MLVERFHEADEIARDEPGPLMNQLIKGVLAIGPRLAPVNGTGVTSHLRPFQRDVLAV